MTDTVAELILRVERLEAMAEIAQLSADYCRGADHRDLELFSSVWTADGVWQVRDDLAFVGLEQIRAGVTRQWETTRRAFHWTSNPAITVAEDGRTAHARHDVQTETQLLDSTWIAVAGSYRDTYVRTEQGWRISRREAQTHSQRGN